MALKWAWSWEDEDAAILEDWGFVFNSTSTTVNDRTSAAGDTWTYTGSPTRYSWEQNGANWFQPPPQAYPGGEGGIAWAFRADGVPGDFFGNVLCLVGFNGVPTGTPILSVRPPGTGAQSLQLRLEGVTGGTVTDVTTAIDYTIWHYFALKYDLTGATYTAELWIDGVLRASLSAPGQTNVNTTSQIRFTGITDAVGKSNKWGQFITYDSVSDSVENVRWVTNYQPTADGTNVGAWVATGGDVNDFSQVAGALNTATYTEEATPTSGDKVNLTGGTIDSQLGVTAPSVDAVVVHTNSTGEGINARGEVGDGASTTDGISTLIDASVPTYAYATAPTKPSGGAWAGTDSPELNYEIV